MSQNASPPTRNNQYAVRVLKPTEINSRLISAWEELETRAIVPNAFMSPHFVMPALRYLESCGNTFGVFVEKTSAGLPDLVGVALFQVRKPTRRFPLQHLAAFETVHSYLSDFLLDLEHASGALKEIYRYLTDKRHAWHGLYLNNFSSKNLLSEETKTIASDFGIRWTLFDKWSRAVLSLSDFGETGLAHLSNRQKKNFRKNLRKLEELGRVNWELKRGTTLSGKNIDEFIRLEHLGWKGQQGTSLYSNPNHLRFFYEIMAGFNEKGQAFFTELNLNGVTISSTSNLISGKAGFAFKVGWDFEYAKYGPGILNELKTLENGRELLSDLEYIDSSAAPDSYINDLWPGRREILEGMYSLTPLGQAALTGTGMARRVKNWLLSRRPYPPTENG